MNHLLHLSCLAQSRRGKGNGQSFDLSPSKQPADHPRLPIAGLKRKEDKEHEDVKQAQDKPPGGLPGS